MLVKLDTFDDGNNNTDGQIYSITEDSDATKSHQVENQNDLQRKDSLRRAYYFQKSRKFRQSWRTQSVETPYVDDRRFVAPHSLTMVESGSESDEDKVATRMKTPACSFDNLNKCQPASNAITAARQIRLISDETEFALLAKNPDTSSQSRRNAEQSNSILCGSRSPVSIETANNETTTYPSNSSATPILSNSVFSPPEELSAPKMNLIYKTSASLPHVKVAISGLPLHANQKYHSTSNDTLLSENSVRRLRQTRIKSLKSILSNSSTHNVGYRLGRRRKMFEQRRIVADISLGLAVVGILLMMIEAEMNMAHICDKDSLVSITLKSLISASTLALVCSIYAYHYFVVKILSFDDSIEDWRVAWNSSRILQLLLEVIVCLIHPFPGNFAFLWPSEYYYSGGGLLAPCSNCRNVTLFHQSSPAKSRSFRINSNFNSEYATYTYSGPHVMYSSNRIVSVDIILSLPMFLRLYLIFRVVFLHAKLFTDTGSRSIGAMNKVSFDASFVFKTFMTISPGTVLVGFIVGFWIVLSWILRSCESVHDPVFGNFFNSAWLVAITFLSIGYGDMVANTYCGRTICILAGVLGSLCTALVVAVFARRLELSKAEKHVLQFMLESQMTKKMKFYAANVLRETWLIYKYTKIAQNLKASTIRRHQRKFLDAICGFRRMKLEQRHLQDDANSLVDLANTQTTIQDAVTEIRIQHTRVQSRLNAIEEVLLALQDQITKIPEMLKYANAQQLQAAQLRDGGCMDENLNTQPDRATICRRRSSKIFAFRTTCASERRLSQKWESGRKRGMDTKLLSVVEPPSYPEDANFAVSFDSTQSQKFLNTDLLNVGSVCRAISEPPSLFPIALRR